MEKYIKSVTALNNLTLLNSNKGEIDRYAESDIFWAANKNKSIPHRQIKKGNIYQFEFGKNFIPEMSYEHRGLVIGTSGKLLYVLPICSYNSNNSEHQNAFHPIDSPENNKSNFFLLKGSEFAFLKHDSVLKLNDIRTVSFLRIKYKQENGYLDPNSDTYKAIEKMVFSKYFYNFSYEYDQLAKESEELTELFDETQKEKEAMQKQIEGIKEMIVAHGFDEACQAYLKEVLGIE